MAKKKRTVLGEQSSPDVKDSRTASKTNINNENLPSAMKTRRQDAMMQPAKKPLDRSDKSDDRNRKIGPDRLAFGDSKTKSLSRAMIENKNDNLADDLARQKTNKEMEDIKERMRARNAKKK